jgi:hypothetical protein
VKDIDSDIMKDQEFLVRYFVIFKKFAEAELKIFSHHLRGMGRKRRNMLSYLISEIFVELAMYSGMSAVVFTTVFEYC